MNIGILASGRASILPAIAKYMQEQNLDAKISVLISDKKHAVALECASSLNIPSVAISYAGLSRQQHELFISNCFSQHNIDLILLIGYMRILSSFFISSWHRKILNIHPSLLPKYSGLMDIGVHNKVLEACDLETGCTVHFVTDVVDGGDIIVQKTCPVFKNDSAQILKARVQTLESQAFVEAIKLFSENFYE